ncbi:MAG: hypothetical protein U9N59_04745 [Campylobacterota bacterium]|nr:hypothetical protein [Campylobacterota bacterium]
MNNKNFLKIPSYIKQLDISEILDNLYFYSYHNKYLQKIQKTDIEKDDPHYISTYSSFVGEVFENIIYELLLKYAIENDDITKFVLKGPHQDHYENLKNGLMIDRNSQIVYKAGYKDVTEFDALFFTKDSVCFVESTIVKTTTSLRKRLKKKKALLEILFPKLKVKALIILSKGAMGVNVFPSYCRVWVTDALDDEKLIQDLIYHNNDTKNRKFKKFTAKKLIHSKDVRVAIFKYFDTLSWILKSLRKQNSNTIIDNNFLTDKKTLKYFEIYSKFYIGHIDSDTFIKLLSYLGIKSISEDIPLQNIQDDQIIVTIDQTKDMFSLVYYLKIVGDKLKKLEVNDDNLIVSNKDPKGFTASETKFMKYLFKNSYKLSLDNLKTMKSLDNFN